MSELQEISATFAVSGGHAQVVTLDVEGLTLMNIADGLLEAAKGVSLCHSCGRDISDPELTEVTSFSLRSVEYIERDGVWIPVQ